MPGRTKGEGNEALGALGWGVGWEFIGKGGKGVGGGERRGMWCHLM